MKQISRKYNDTVTIAGRCLLLSKRNPEAFFTSILLPMIMMVLFVALFGNLIQIEGSAYIDFIVPGILLQCIAQGSAVTAVSMSRDISGGMMTRLSTLPVRKTAILNGHAAEAFVRSFLTVAVVLLIAVLLGFRPSLRPADLIVVFLQLAGMILTLSWFGILVGTVANSAEGASGLCSVGIILPYISSGFVPVDTLPTGIRYFAKYQPMTPMIDTLREALTGNPLEPERLLAALLWCAGLTALFGGAAGLLLRKRLAR